jgi:hypothetical protein
VISSIRSLNELLEQLHDLPVVSLLDHSLDCGLKAAILLQLHVDQLRLAEMEVENTICLLAIEVGILDLTLKHLPSFVSLKKLEPLRALVF